MVRIAITPAAYDAICATLPLGSVGYEAEANERGERYVWLEAAMVDRLGAIRAGRARPIAMSSCGSPGWRARAPHSSGPFRPCLRAPLDGNGGDVNLR